MRASTRPSSKPAPIRPQVVSAFLAITSAGTPLGAAVTGYAIAGVGFRPTYVGIAAVMTLATLLLALCVRRSRETADAVPATSLS
jgi:predicted MFS family arabinose efflux permease